MNKKNILFNKNSFLNIANLLTIFRIILVIPFIILMSLLTNYLMKQNYEYFPILDKLNLTYFIISGSIFTMAMFTDFLDGFLARKYNLISTFGKLFDPLADKWITTTTFIFFTINRFIPFWIVIIFILRDLLVDASKNIAAKNSSKVAASKLGKLKTFMQSISIIMIFIILPIKNINFLEYWLMQIPVLLALLLSVISGIQYFLNIYKYLKK